MYKTFLHIFLLLLISTTSSIAQNLVFNGDFEIYDVCPTNVSHLGDLQVEHCTGWTAPTKMGTSDYFNFCNNPSFFKPVGVPKNLLGYQPAFNGNGYGGFLAWVINKTNGIDINYREYLQTTLVKPLIAGNEYHFSFFVSYYGYNYSVEKIGALFSATDFNGNNFNPIVANPQVVNLNGPITDSLNWTKIEGDFIASGGELYLTIGYFEDSLTVTDTLNTHNDRFISPESYYYVDGVELIDITQEAPIETDSLFIPNIFSPNKDGFNDDFQLNFEYTTVVVYNRWGQVIFESNNNDAIWDGRTTSGSEVPEGTYYYIITTAKEVYKGYLQLLRGSYYYNNK